MGADHTPTVSLSATAFANRLRWYAHLLAGEERALNAYVREQTSAFRAGDQAALNRTILANDASRDMDRGVGSLLALANAVLGIRLAANGAEAPAMEFDGIPVITDPKLAPAEGPYVVVPMPDAQG